MNRLSTGLVNFKAAGGSQKEAFQDGVLRIYNQPPPDDADKAYSGSVLLEITLNGGTFVAGTKSTPRKDTITIGSCVLGQTFIVTIAGTAYTYTAVSADDTNEKVALKVAALVETSGLVRAVTDGAAKIVMTEKFAGTGYTVAVSGTGTISTANVNATARAVGIQFGSSIAGVLSKEAGTWSGVGLVEGDAAGYRLFANAVDANGLSTTAIRRDGTVGTLNSGADMTMPYIHVYVGVTNTVDQFSITEPKVKT